MAELKPSEKRRIKEENERMHKVGVAGIIPKDRIRDGLDFHRIRRRRDFGEVKRQAVFAVQLICAFLLALCVVRGVGIRIRMSGQSMEPAIEEEDSVLLNRVVFFVKKPKRGDIIAFYPGGNRRAKLSIKRIIGVPGDVVLIKNGAVYLNGEALSDIQTGDDIHEAGRASTEVKLGEGEYFVLGDNRNNSEDSRYESVGNVKKSDITGKAWLCVSPRRFGLLN